MTSYLLVADDGGARLFTVVGPAGSHRLEEVQDLVCPAAHLQPHEIMSDRTGRVFERASRDGGSAATNARHGAASDYDPRTVEATRFAKQLVEILERLRLSGALDDWAVIAAPHFLGVLRARLPEPLHRLLSHEVASDLVRADRKRILETLERSAAQA